MVIKFTDVGRYKKSWVTKTSYEADYRFLISQIKKQKALASKYIDFDFDFETGEIIAGSRTVGRFEILEEKE